MLLSRSSKRELVACQRHARGQADILRQRVRRLEIEQRPEIGAANFQGEAGLGLLRPWLRRTVGVGIEPLSGDLRLEPQRSHPMPPSPNLRIAPGRRRRRSRDRARAAPARNGPAPTTASTRCRFRCARAPARSMPWIAATERLRGDRGDALELRRIDIDHGARIGTIGLPGALVEIEREFDARGPRARPHRVEPRSQRRRKRRHQRGDLAKRRRRRMKFQLPDRSEAIETADAFQRDLVRLTNIQLVERERLRSIAKPGHQRPQLLAGRNGAADVERQLPFVRPFGLRAGQRTRKRRGRIEVEAFGLQLRCDLRAAAWRRRCETAMRPSTAPPSISAFIASMANPSGAMVTSPRSRNGFWLR